MERLTLRSSDTNHENGVCCTHFHSKECLEVGGNCAYGCKWEEAAWERLADYEDWGGAHWEFTEEDFGTKVFLNQEDAEKARRKNELWSKGMSFYSER